MTSTENISPEQPTSNAILLNFLQAAASWNLSVRLAVRNHPIFDLTDFHDRVHALVLNLDAVNDFALVLSRVSSFAHELAKTIQALIHLHHVLSDVIGLDLRYTDLSGIPLEGLRWSAKTRWPPQIEHQIRHNSTKIADDIFEVGPDTTTD